MLGGWELAVALVSTFFGAIVLGTIGFGLGTVAMPFLLLAMPPQDAVVIVNAMIIPTTGLTLLQTRRHLDLRKSWPFVAAGLPPVPLGVLLLHGAEPSALRIAIVVLILGLAVLTLFQVRLPGARRRLMAPLLGFVTTLLVTTLGVGAPLAGLYAIEQGWSRDEIRATLALYFCLAAALAMALFLATGLVTASTAQNIGVIALAVGAGAVVAALLARRMTFGAFRYAVLAVTLAGSVSLLTREFLSLV